ncbi:cytochrome d ubiquinol oxidase subunit II [Geodermatophilus ruber]|uniref:Cytochrome d ubiquinol oxidase subunit II n=1 Tax=Geodermatophilus ruber TaxID=504800 RepID=A0A1I4LWX4_9ACTN|nr:cytochrome d ubiquinol oxidase subunit II [Geodermatophilus ruber]SFL95470.1 cytochrome d ubiquinol oxidase subunit II [Geodermatophilus ruber]
MTPAPETLAVATILLAVMAAYALFAGADFGGGIWDLLAGGPERGARPRAAIDASITPVWEGNQVWTVFGLVLLWTAFPPAFAAVMTTLFIPIAVGVFGILVRGVGFAFRHEAERLPTKALTGALFAAASLLTPFFFGTAVGAVATGQVPADGSGSSVGSWTTPTALLTGTLFVAACAYVAAVYLVGDSHRRDQPDLVRYFSRRALAAGVLTGALAAVNLVLLHGSAPYLFDRLTGPALPLVVASVVAGIAALVVIVLQRPWALRTLAAIAVATVVGGWGWAQYPYLLPPSLTLAAGSAPVATMRAELAVAALVVVIVAPSYGYLLWLQQHDRLQEIPTTAELREEAAGRSTAEAARQPAAR